MLVCALLCSLPVLSIATMLPVLSVEVIERQTDYVMVHWTVNDTDNTISSYKVQVNDDSYAITYEGEPYVNQKKEEARVMVHEPNQSYNICVVAVLTGEASQELSIQLVSECVEASTIQLVLTSSIIALALTLLFFVLCFVVGCITWKCAHSRMKKLHREYETSDVNGNGDIVPLTHIET